jgi:hypothetical protein
LCLIIEKQISDSKQWLWISKVLICVSFDGFYSLKITKLMCYFHYKNNKKIKYFKYSFLYLIEKMVTHNTTTIAQNCLINCGILIESIT